MAYRKTKGGPFWTWRRQQNGLRRQVSLKTHHREFALELERMARRLEDRHEWELLDAFPLTELHRAWNRDGQRGLDALHKRLREVDLSTLIDAWYAWAELTTSSGAPARYLPQLRILIPDGKPFPASEFNPSKISEALGALKVTGSTAQRYRAAWSSFGRFLVEREVLSTNPVRFVKSPRACEPRAVYLSLQDQQRLVAAQPDPYRAMAALREGGGLEYQAASRVRLIDCDFEKGIVRARGSKRSWRDRSTFVEPWAMAHVKAYVETIGFLDPQAMLFDPVRYKNARRSHNDALHKLGLREDYRMHDSRHSIAVRWIQKGVNPEIIAANLGHKDAAMVIKIYGKYRPKDAQMAAVRALLGEEVEATEPATGNAELFDTLPPESQETMELEATAAHAATPERAREDTDT